MYIYKRSSLRKPLSSSDQLKHWILFPTFVVSSHLVGTRRSMYGICCNRNLWLVYISYLYINLFSILPLYCTLQKLFTFRIRAYIFLLERGNIYFKRKGDSLICRERFKSLHFFLICCYKNCYVCFCCSHIYTRSNNLFKRDVNPCKGIRFIILWDAKENN